MTSTFDMVAKTLYGLEEILAGELIALGANDVQIGRRMVSFTGDKELLYKANFYCRTALRILKPIYHFKAKDADTVYKEVKKIQWEDFITLDKTFAIDSVVHSEDFNHSKFVAYRTKDAIVDYFMEKYEKRPSVRVNKPDLYINIHISHNDCTISIDSSGESLHKRGYRVEQTEAPLNEVLAAGMILKTGWTGESNFVDPMCGSGTLLIEAAMIALNIAPGIHRKEFAFEKWVDFDSELFDRIYNDETREREFNFKCYGSDIAPAAIDIALKNVRSAGLAKYIDLQVLPFQQYTEAPRPGILVTNPPYGERISSRDLMGLYGMIGERVKHVFTDYKVWILSYKDECFDKIGLRPNEKIKLMNGSLECEYRCYEIFEGKNKEYKKAINERGEGKKNLPDRLIKRKTFPAWVTAREEGILNRPAALISVVKEMRNGIYPEENILRIKIKGEGNPASKTMNGVSAGHQRNYLKRIEKMINRILSILFLLTVYTGMSAQEKELTLHDLIPGGKTYRDFVPGSDRTLPQWAGNYFFYVGDESFACVAEGGKKGDIGFSISTLNKALDLTGEKEIRKMPTLTVPYSDKTIVSFRWNGHIYHYNFRSYKLVGDYVLPEKGENYQFSSGNSYFAYTQDNNIFLLSPDNQVTPITHETQPGIVCGQAVHQREFGIHKGLFWSPSGKSIAFYRMDESMVTDYPLVDISARIAAAEPFKYPMAGMKSHEVTVGIYHLETAETIWLQTGLPKEKYLTNITWTPDEKGILIAELNRDQNECVLVKYNAQTGEKEYDLFTETRNTYVEPQNPPLFIPGQPDRFIWQSDRDGTNHLYMYDIRGNLMKQLTSGEWVVKEVLGIDPSGSDVYLLSTAPPTGDTDENQTAMDTYGWKINIKTGKQTCLTPEKGVHRLRLNPSCRYGMDIYSSPEVPQAISFIDLKSSKRYRIYDALDPFKEKGYDLPVIQTGILKAADGVTDLNYRIVKPHDLDETKKYPVIIYVYGGPHSQLINGGWQYGTRGWDIYIAQKGYIVFTVDGRGSANRGHAFESAIFRNLGENEMADQMQGVAYLLSLPYVDATRIGVHGWSYGGFMTTNLMLTYPDVFKVGVAGGPVIDWHLYEIMYGERYMDHPGDNPGGYKRADLTQRAGDLKGRLMLIHGDMDPVVVWQHSLRFLKACVEAGTYPDYFVYPGHGHNVIGKDRPHLYEKITRYFEDFL